MASKDLRIDTDKARAAAAQFEEKNTKIKTSFSTVETSIGDLKYVWQGNAASAAFAAFDGLKKGVCHQRETSLLQLARFLRNIIGEGYDLVEEASINYADYFK